MLPRIILMHKLTSFHSEPHSGGSMELPSKGLLRDFSQKSLFISTFPFDIPFDMSHATSRLAVAPLRLPRRIKVYEQISTPFDHRSRFALRMELTVVEIPCDLHITPDKAHTFVRFFPSPPPTPPNNEQKTKSAATNKCVRVEITAYRIRFNP